MLYLGRRQDVQEDTSVRPKNEGPRGEDGQERRKPERHRGCYPGPLQHE